MTQRMFQILSVFILLLGAAAIFLSRLPSDTADVNPLTAPQKGFFAPDFEVLSPDGQVIRLSSLRGSPVILNLWASWCPPCREEMPALQTIYQEYRDRGLVVLGANITSQDSRDDALDFATSHNLMFPIALDEKGDISRLYRLQALPTTFFIDSGGIIRDVIIGGPVAEAVFRAQAEALLQEAR